MGKKLQVGARAVHIKSIAKQAACKPGLVVSFVTCCTDANLSALSRDTLVVAALLQVVEASKPGLCLDSPWPLSW